MTRSELEQTWLMQKWQLVRECQTAADRSSREWNRMNEAFNEWCRKSGITDPASKAYRKKLNLELADHYSAWNWNRQEAHRHMQDILTFKAMKDMRAL